VTVPDAQAFGFTVSTTEIVFRGRCRDCAAAGGDDPPETRSSAPGHNQTQEASGA
jgi:hypothetical protein